MTRVSTDEVNFMVGTIWRYLGPLIGLCLNVHYSAFLFTSSWASWCGTGLHGVRTIALVAVFARLWYLHDPCIYTSYSWGPCFRPISKNLHITIPNKNKRNYGSRHGLGSNLGRLGQRKNMGIREIPGFVYTAFYLGFLQVVRSVYTTPW
jgi:hypothetical protein